MQKPLDLHYVAYMKKGVLKAEVLILGQTSKWATGTISKNTKGFEDVLRKLMSTRNITLNADQKW